MVENPATFQCVLWYVTRVNISQFDKDRQGHYFQNLGLQSTFLTYSEGNGTEHALLEILLLVVISGAFMRQQTEVDHLDTLDS